MHMKDAQKAISTMTTVAKAFPHLKALAEVAEKANKLSRFKNGSFKNNEQYFDCVHKYCEEFMDIFVEIYLESQLDKHIEALELANGNPNHVFRQLDSHVKKVDELTSEIKDTLAKNNNSYYKYVMSGKGCQELKAKRKGCRTIVRKLRDEYLTPLKQAGDKAFRFTIFVDNVTDDLMYFSSNNDFYEKTNKLKSQINTNQEKVRTIEEVDARTYCGDKNYQIIWNSIEYTKKIGEATAKYTRKPSFKEYLL